LVGLSILIIPEQVWAISEIDSELNNFKKFVLDSVLKTIAVVA